MGVFRSDEVWGERELKVPRSIIVSMSPPGYPSAWLHPCRARFRFAWQNHCSSLRYLPINSTDEALIMGARDCAAYLDILRDPLRGPSELDALIVEVTIGETYFFRH